MGSNWSGWSFVWERGGVMNRGARSFVLSKGGGEITDQTRVGADSINI